MSRIAVTGASGFVGSALCRSLDECGHSLRRIVHRADQATSGNSDTVAQNITPSTEWGETLAGIDIVIHLAARVHIMNEAASGSLQLFQEINTAGTERLAEAAAEAGVQRFIFLSSIKVNGEFTTDRPFDESMPAAPQDPYAISKYEAELRLRKIAEASSMEVVIIRPSLIYGPGVKANFLRLLEWVGRGIPLPLAGIENRRSLIALDNLVDFLTICLDHPAAANETFLISDGEDLSTTELVRCIAKHAGHPARLFPLPQPLMKWAASLLGKKPMVDRLTRSLQIDSGKTRQQLQWQPPLSVDEAMAKTVDWYLQQKTT